MSPRTPLQDSSSNDLTEEVIRSYKEAAIIDEFLFGDYDYETDWLGKNTNDVA